MAREALEAHERPAWLMGWDSAYMEKVRQARSVTDMRSYWERRLSLEMVDDNPYHRSTWQSVGRNSGNKDQALVWLKMACQQRSYWDMYLNVVPTLDPLRSDPRFSDLLRQVGPQS